MRFGQYEMNEGDFYKLIKKMLDENRITQEEHDKMELFVCGIYDYCDGMGFDLNEEEEEDDW